MTKKNLVGRIVRYIKERFLLTQYVPLVVVLGLPVATAISRYYKNLNPDLLSVFLTLTALLLFLFRLRIFDEFKDHEHDARFYPERPVPRGLISLKELEFILIPVMLVEVLIALVVGFPATLLFIIAFLYSLLMLKEFFVRTWLRAHFTVYIITHEILIIPLFLYLFYMNGMPDKEITGSFSSLLLLFVGAQLFLLEVTRKFRSRENEIPSRDTYTAQYGKIGATLLCAILIISSSIAGFFILSKTNPGLLLWYLLILMPIIFTLIMLVLFISNPIDENAKKIFKNSIILVFTQCILFSILTLL